MSARGLALAAGLGLGLGLSGGCVEPELELECADAVIETEVFLFAAVDHDFEDYCEAGFDAAESHARWVAEAWGEPLDHQILYRLLTDRDHECWPCIGSATACATSNAIAAPELPHRHEIAHAARGLPCYTLLEEGWAMLYGDPLGGDTEGDLLAVLDATEGRTLPGTYYGFAARFVAFLIETRGVDSVRRICTNYERSRAGLEQAVIEEYGVTIEELAAELDEFPAPPADRFRRDQACFDEVDDAVQIPGEWSHDLDCGGPEVTGRRGVELSAHQTFEIPEDWEGGFLTFEISTDGSSELVLGVNIRSCAREGPVPAFHWGGLFRPNPGDPARPIISELQPGIHVMRVVMQDVGNSINDWSELPTVHVRVEPYP